MPSTVLRAQPLLISHRQHDNPLFAHATVVTPHENALRQKRARRFDDDAPSKAGSGLVARMGSSTLTTPEPEATYNPVRSHWILSQLHTDKRAGCHRLGPAYDCRDSDQARKAVPSTNIRAPGVFP